MIERLNLGKARYLVTAIPDAFEAGHLVEAAKAANPAIHVIAGAHDAEGVAYRRKPGADDVLMGEEQLAHAMLEPLQAGRPASPIGQSQRGTLA